MRYSYNYNRILFMLLIKLFFIYLVYKKSYASHLMSLQILIDSHFTFLEPQKLHVYLVQLSFKYLTYTL